MKKPIILAVVLAIILTAILSLAMVSSKGNYVKIVPVQEHNRSFTKAICDSKNLCQDYEIFCKDLEVIKMNPITGAVVQFSVDWEDPRDEELRNSLC